MHLVAALKVPGQNGGSFSAGVVDALQRRRTDRRSLTLSTLTSSRSAGETQVVIRDISVGGLLIDADLGVLSKGDTIELNLPELGSVRARVVWQSGRFSGCQFGEPVPESAISAALLKAEPGNAASMTKAAEAPVHDRVSAFEPELNFSVALILSLILWALIGAAAYLFIF